MTDSTQSTADRLRGKDATLLGSVRRDCRNCPDLTTIAKGGDGVMLIPVSGTTCDVVSCERNATHKVMWRLLHPQDPTNGDGIFCDDHTAAITESAFESAKWKLLPEGT